MLRILLLLLGLAACSPADAEVLGGEASAINSASTDELPLVALRSAIQKSISPLQQGATVSANERQCFTCHNQAIPVLALTAVAKRGFDIDKEALQRQLQHTWNHLDRGRQEYRVGKGQGGQVMTAGYAMWTLEAGRWQPDNTTAAVAHYLVEYQKDKNRWSAGSKRPPSAGSLFTSTYVALRALSHYGTDEQTDSIKARREAAAKWVLETEPGDTEDRVFQLRSLSYISADEAAIGKAVDALLASQHTNGGWSQADKMPPDAYATATVLAALQEIGRLPANHPAVVSAGQCLIDSQLADGTWHVVTHANPIQDYYESGFPHGEDQFISIAATGWATLALALTLPARATD